MQRFGRYTVVRQLGSGGMADVFEAVAVGAEGFERRVAIKRIRPDQHDARHGRMFVDEARLAGRLHHGNIVAVLDYGFDGDAPFQVLELVDGPDLAALLREGPIPLGLALHIGREIAWALDHAHRAADDEGRSLGIVHRDVSASNVLLSRDGDVKLTDFGIAFATERSEATQAGTVKGKAAYMAPEQLTGAPVDGRSDLFGLACLIHRATTGATPLQEEDRMMRLLAGEPLLLHPTLPEDVRGVLAQALSLSRSDRPRDAASFAASLAELVSAHLTADPRHALRDLLRERTSSPAAATASLFDLALIDPDAARFERTETAEAPPPPAPKRMRWAVAVALVAALASAGLAVSFSQSEREEQSEPVRETPALAQAEDPPDPVVEEAVEARVEPVKTDTIEPAKLPSRMATMRATMETPAPMRSVQGVLRIGGAGAIRAAIEVDGRAAGYAPRLLWLPVGEHRVRLVTAEGSTLERTIAIEEHHTASASQRWIVP